MSLILKVLNENKAKIEAETIKEEFNKLKEIKKISSEIESLMSLDQESSGYQDILEDLEESYRKFEEHASLVENYFQDVQTHINKLHTSASTPKGKKMAKNLEKKVNNLNK